MLIGWSVSIILLLSMIRTIPLEQFWIALHQINPLFILLAVVFALFNLWIRGYRWAFLFYPHYQVSPYAAFSLSSIGLAINAILPGRVGELARIGLATKKFCTSVTFTTATVVIERLLDGIILLSLLGFSLFFLPQVKVTHSVQWLGHTVDNEIILKLMKGIAVICFTLVVFVIGFIIPYTRQAIYHLLSKIPFIGQWVNQNTVEIFKDLGNCFGSLKDLRTVSKLFVYSITLWLAIAVYNYLIALGMSGIQLTFLQTIVVTSMSITASSLPSAPGAWGVFEAGALFALVILGIPFEQAAGVTYVIIIHIVNYLLVVLLGIMLALQEHMSLLIRVKEKEENID